MKTTIKRLTVFLLALVLLAAASGAAAAEEQEKVIIYTVAHLEPIAGHEGAEYFKLCGEFEDCGVNIAYLTGENLAEHLVVYADSRGIPGEELSGRDYGDLAPGLYLAVHFGGEAVCRLL